MTEQPEYKVELDAYSGPLDLLLYLIRQEEVDIWNIPIARITEQYLRYLDMMSELNIAVAGEFIVMAATLIEIKSRMLAPEPEPMPEEDPDDPRLELVRQLMEYKRFKEAALALNERAELRAERFARPGERPEGAAGAPPEGAAGVSLWTLLEAFSKVLRQTGEAQPHRLVLEGIPQEQIQRDLEETLRAAGRTTFAGVFQGQVGRMRLIGTFIALLELVKRQVVRIVQEVPFGEIWVTYLAPEERWKEGQAGALSGAEAAAAAPALSEVEGPAALGEVESDEPEFAPGDDDEWPADSAEMTLPEVPEIGDPAPPAAEGAD